MRVLVLGATGAIGILTCRECLLAGHTLMIFARSPEKLPEDISKHHNVVIIKGGFDDEASLGKAMEGVHAVISSLGPSVTRGPFHPGNTPLAHAYVTIIRVMAAHNVKRLICLGTASIKDPNDKFSAAFWAMVNTIKTFAYNAYKDVVAIGDTVRAEKDLIWTIARVPVLTSGDNNGVNVGYIGEKSIGTSLNRAAYAAFVIQELEKNDWAQKAPMIASA